MRIVLGKDFFDAKHGKSTPVLYDSSELVNGHVLLVGASGMGKSHTLRRMMDQANRAKERVRFHVFDVHGDLHIDGASVVQFSEQAPYGLNPLRVNPDPDYGGVRKCVQAFIRTVNQASTTALGVKQESVLRNLLFDVFRDYGFFQDDPSTWGVNEYEKRLVGGVSDNRLYLEVPLAEKDEAKAFGARWDPDRKHWWVHTHLYKGELRRWPPAYKERAYPTVLDVARYAKRLYEERFLGSDQAAVRALGQLNRKAQALQRRILDAAKLRRFDGYDDESDEELDAARQKALEAFENYVNAVRTGHELESLLKYDSADVLKSVADRLDNLNASGVFKSAVPPFDDKASVWRYKLNPLSTEEKKMFVLFTLYDIFNRAMQRGETAGVVEVVVLDELATYTSSADDDSGEGIIGVIAREARKFGLALWAATQSPANVPESLVSSTATKIILGIDEMYWPAAVSKMRIEAKQLEWIKAHESMAVQMKKKGALKNRWWWVVL